MFLASNEQTSNIELSRTHLMELLIEQTRLSIFQTSTWIEHVHVLVIELEHLKVMPGIDHLVRSLQACVIWLTAAQTGGQYLREDHTPKIGMKFSCQFIDERSVSSHKPKLLQRERRASSAPQSRENPQKLKLLVLRDIFLFNKGKFQIGKRNLEERS